MTPNASAGMGDLVAVWTCSLARGVFLDFDSGLTVLEDDSSMFDRSPGGAAGFFEAAAAQGDGRPVEVEGFPGWVTAADGVELKGPVVQFIGGGDRILVRAADPSKTPESLVTMARRFADQLRSGDGVRAPTSS